MSEDHLRFIRAFRGFELLPQVFIAQLCIVAQLEHYETDGGFGEDEHAMRIRFRFPLRGIIGDRNGRTDEKGLIDKSEAKRGSSLPRASLLEILAPYRSIYRLLSRIWSLYCRKNFTQLPPEIESRYQSLAAKSTSARCPGTPRNAERCRFSSVYYCVRSD